MTMQNLQRPNKFYFGGVLPQCNVISLFLHATKTTRSANIIMKDFSTPLLFFLPVHPQHHGEPGPAGGRQLADQQERFQRGEQQRRELQGEFPVLHPLAGRRPLGSAAGEDAQEDGVGRSLVLTGVLPPSHRQWSCQSHL